MDSRFRSRVLRILNLESKSALKRFKAVWGAQAGLKIPDLESWES